MTDTVTLSEVEIPKFSLPQRVLDCVLPVGRANSWGWMGQHSFTKKGVPFNTLDYPWVKGIADAWDDPAVRRIFFMAGSRLGKTETGLCLMHASQDHNPDVGMIVGPTQTIVEETIGDRFWSMMAKSPKTIDLCPPPSRRAKLKVKTTTFTIYGAWSGSPTTLGDKDPKYLQLFEVDKYTKNKSEEADPFLLAMARGEEIPERTVFAESTPTIEGHSRIAKYVYKSTNERFNVPCPHCGEYQELVWNEGQDREEGGLWWERDDEGRAIPNTAHRTAEYVCCHCKEVIPEELRRPAVRKGVWVAEGQTIDTDGVVHGEPTNAGPDRSFHISRLYGPTFSFADCARAYVESRDDVEEERSFENNWRGKPWVPLEVQMKWEDLASKLCVGEWEVGHVPEDCIFLTTAVDVQLDHFVVATFGWDNQRTGYLVRHDTVPSWDKVYDWINTAWPHADGRPMFSMLNLVDSKDGNRQEEIQSFCRDHNCERSPWIWPLEGAKYGAMTEMFRKRSLETSFGRQTQKRKDKIEGLYVITVNTTMTQNWIDNAMYRRRPFDPQSVILPAEIVEDRDLFEQLLNERFDPIEGKHVRIDESTIPVDFRDTFRYCRTAAEVYVNGNWSRQPRRRPVYHETKEQREHRQRVIARDKEVLAQPEAEKKSFIRKPKTRFFMKRR